MKAAVTITTDADLRSRITACWLGKAVGGTLGMPYEGVRHTLDLTFYDPVPQEMLPNDDLDLQVIYAFLLDRMPPEEVRVDRRELAKAWPHIGMSPDEYGIVKRNLKLGLMPPATGAYDNPFARGMGAAIRTELWACLAPGNPDLAVKYAYEDACMDHAGEGIDAALFLAAVEALAFVESDRDTLLDAGLSYIDADSELARAIRDTRMLWEELGDWKKVQAVLAERYLNDNFTDVVINLACTVLGWLSGKDFGESICIAVNCGQDTDCTGATLGALLGILNPDGIEAKWLEPIGRDLVLSPCIHGVEHPPTLGGFTDLVLDLRRRLGGSAPSSPPLEAPAEVTPRASSEPADRSGGVSGGGDASGGFRGLAIKAGVAALDAMPDARPPEGSFTATTFPGNWVTQAVDADDPPYLAVRYAVHVDTDAKTHLMFNTPQAVKVWWGDQLVIDSAGGGFVPALHRTVPGDQNVPLGDALGDHVVTAVMARPEDGQSRQWCVALTDDAPEEDGWAVARNWLVDPFDRVGT